MLSLHTEMRACRRCLRAGYAITPGAVFTGGPTADVMLIGQAPGVTEVAAKRPFNAGSGQRLFQWLGEAGWEEGRFRSEQYMTAVTKCYPGRSKTGKGDRVPSKAEQQLCRPFLDREMVQVNPRLVILVGGLAIKLMFPAGLRLKAIIGTAAYFPPTALNSPATYDLSKAERFESFVDGKDRNGRWIVPLPHPSGASLWPNRAENQRLIARAIAILADIRQNWL